MVNKFKQIGMNLSDKARSFDPALPSSGCGTRSRLIHQQVARFGSIFVTEDAAGLRTLRFSPNGPRQSVVDINNPRFLALRYTKSAMLSLGLVARPGRILVLGLGGGAMPMFLRSFLPEAQIDAVEIDPAVIDVAKRFLNFREDRRMSAYALDGRRFIQLSSQPYDLVFLDAFALNAVPGHLITAEFLSDVSNITSKNGAVVANLWGPALNPQYDAMLCTYQEMFACLYLLEVPRVENRMVFAFPKARSLTTAGLRGHLSATSSSLKLPFDLAELINAGFHRLDRPLLTATVLRDPLKPLVRAHFSDQ